MSVRESARERRLGVVGVAGLVATLAAGVLESNPWVVRTVAPVAEFVVEVLFVFAVVSAFVTGFAVTLYAYLNERRGTVTPHVHRVSSAGIYTVLLLALAFPLVLVDEVAALLGRVLADVGPPVPERHLFYASVAVFGTLTLVSALSALRFRIAARRH